MEWSSLPDVIIQEIFGYIDLYKYHERFHRINKKKQKMLVWKPEYEYIVQHCSPLYYSFQFVDLKNNKYEQDLAIQIIHNKEICRANELLKKLNEMYSRKYYKHQSSFTNLYGITFTRNDFDKRYQKLINNEVYLFYLRNHVIFYGCVNWKGEDPSSWMNH